MSNAAVREREILLLEDDLIQTMLFRGAVDGVLGRVTNFTDVDEALRTMERAPFDLCVADLGVFVEPGVFDDNAGVGFVDAVRREISTTIPIIIATSDRKPGNLIASFQAGADDYMLKDEGLERVIERMRGWLKDGPFEADELERKRAEILDFLGKAHANNLDLPD